MTATEVPASHRPRGDASGSEPVTLRRVVASEWVKLRTLRSPPALLALSVVAMVAFGLIIAYNTRHLGPDLQANDVAPSGPLQGYYLGQLLVGALGVLVVSGEYGTGTIRATLIAVPRRVPVLVAKLVVLVGVTAATMIPASVVAFAAAQALLSQYRTGTSLGAPGALRVAVGTGVYLVLVGVIGSGLGWIVRSTPGALVAYVALVLVLPVLFGDALGHWGKEVAQYLPTPAGAAFSTSVPDAHPSLAPWAGLGVMALWAAALVVAGAMVLRRRDA